MAQWAALKEVALTSRAPVTFGATVVRELASKKFVRKLIAAEASPAERFEAVAAEMIKAIEEVKSKTGRAKQG